MVKESDISKRENSNDNVFTSIEVHAVYSKSVKNRARLATGSAKIFPTVNLDL